MSGNDGKKRPDILSSDIPAKIGIHEFEYILNVNTKAVEIYMEVERQNNTIIDQLDEAKEDLKEVRGKIEDNYEITRNVNRLIEDKGIENQKAIKEKLDDILDEVKAAKQIMNDMKVSHGDTLYEMTEISKKMVEIEKTGFRIMIALTCGVLSVVGAIIVALLKR